MGLATTGVLALPAAAAASDDGSTYTVGEGDTLSHVALRTNTSIEDLRDLNGLGNVDRIYVGQRLVVSVPTITYTVADGDTLSALAVKWGTTTTELVALNGLVNDDRIRVGQQLQIPATSLAAVIDTIDLDRYPNLPERIRQRPERLALIPVFERWAAANDLPVDLLMATAWHESGWNQEALSSAGAVGVGQLMPVTAEWIGASLIGQPALDRFEVEDNIRMSARYLDWLLDRNDGDVRLSLGGYFQGPTSVSNGEWLDATEQYVANVMAQRALFTDSTD
ncbi:MAG: LysM peptidoglycan-binding domain-containing protein [Acidimicrobiales bacterium]